ncbi:hypothetical protein BKA69DRAFT_1041647 [Paraphysoderma sedebokerense]|nr:hypothetical protein BKA69DRAFT_1041647 [Paraphysoderma sedebokerense]
MSDSATSAQVNTELFVTLCNEHLHSLTNQPNSSVSSAVVTLISTAVPILDGFYCLDNRLIAEFEDRPSLIGKLYELGIDNHECVQASLLQQYNKTKNKVRRQFHEEIAKKNVEYLNQALELKIDPLPTLSDKRIALIDFINMYKNTVGSGPFVRGLRRSLEYTEFYIERYKNSSQRVYVAWILDDQILVQPGERFMRDGIGLLKSLGFNCITSTANIMIQETIIQIDHNQPLLESNSDKRLWYIKWDMNLLGELTQLAKVIAKYDKEIQFGNANGEWIELDESGKVIGKVKVRRKSGIINWLAKWLNYIFRPLKNFFRWFKGVIWS